MKTRSEKQAFKARVLRAAIQGVRIELLSQTHRATERHPDPNTPGYEFDVTDTGLVKVFQGGRVSEYFEIQIKERY
jgi:hypothetical protein